IGWEPDDDDEDALSIDRVDVPPPPGGRSSAPPAPAVASSAPLTLNLRAFADLPAALRLRAWHAMMRLGATPDARQRVAQDFGIESNEMPTSHNELLRNVRDLVEAQLRDVRITEGAVAEFRRRYREMLNAVRHSGIGPRSANVRPLRDVASESGL